MTRDRREAWRDVAREPVEGRCDMSTRPNSPTRPCPPIQPRRGMRRGMQPHDGTGVLELRPYPWSPPNYRTCETHVGLRAVELPPGAQENA